MNYTGAWVCFAHKLETHEKHFKVKLFKIDIKSTELLPTKTHSYEITGHVTKKGA